MVPSDYTTPETMRALDDATRVGGALTGILAALLAAGVGVRRWWHRRRDRQERILREVVASLESRLDERLAAGDYVELQQVQNSGGNLALTTGVGGTSFQAIWQSL